MNLRMSQHVAVRLTRMSGRVIHFIKHPSLETLVGRLLAHGGDEDECTRDAERASHHERCLRR
jgi:hypothetical protein